MREAPVFWSNTFTCRWRGAVRACVAGVAIGAVLVATDQLLVHFLGLEGIQRIVDDAAGGVIGGALVYIYERRRARELKQKLNTIQLMNHHVRNSLQVISWSQYSIDDQQKVQGIREAIARIDWALREILPGARSERPRSLHRFDGSADPQN